MDAGLTRIKRKHCGQKGNQNARKHGFYSSTINPDEMCRLQDIIAQESIDPEIACLRVKLQSLVQYSPDCRAPSRSLQADRKMVSKKIPEGHMLSRNEILLTFR